MKILTTEEAATLPVLRGRFSRIHGNLAKLKVGEALIIEKGIDWIGKKAPDNNAMKYQVIFIWVAFDL